MNGESNHMAKAMEKRMEISGPPNGAIGIG